MTRHALTLAALAALAPSAARAQTEAGGPHLVCRLPADAPGTRAPDAASRGPSRAVPCDAADQTARFDVEYVGFPADARAAFQAAVDTWACRVAAPRPVRILARWEPLDATTLGNAGPFLFRNFDGAPLPNTWYPAALADGFAGRDLDADQPDILARFNSAFPSWHLDPATPPPPDRYSLSTVVLHEIAHGLGFIGALAVVDGLGYVGVPDRTRGPYVFDRFTEDGPGTPLLDTDMYPDRSVALSAALRNGRLTFDGPAVRQATGAPAGLYAPAVWNEGASYSHLDEGDYAPGTPDGLMTPFLARGEAVAEPGTAVCAVLADIGWTLAGDCAVRVGERPVAPAALTLERTGPNPFTRRTGMRLRAAVPGVARVVLLDAAGRRVAVLAARSVGAGEALDVDVDGAGLAAGVYFVHAAVGEAERLAPLVIVR